jgi:diguanylate cyclase (GGDEF)-like protein
MSNPSTTSQLKQYNELLPFGVLCLDVKNHITWVNQNVEAFFGIPAAQLLNKTISEVCENSPNLSQGNLDTIFVKSSSLTQERWLKQVTQTMTTALDFSESVLFLVDISEYKNLKEKCDRLSDQVQELATVDPNTGLLTQRAMLQNLDLLVSRSRRYHNPLSVIVMEVYQKGEQQSNLVKKEVLVAIGQLLMDQMRWADLISHAEQNQFLLILPETSKEAAEQLISKITAQLDKLSVPYTEGEVVPIGAWFGVASWQKSDDSNFLLGRANQMLMDAKHD